MQRQKITLRLDPQVEALGRKLAKADFGSETKLGVLIEHAIQAYHARQLTELEAAGLLSAAERALVERLEKRFDEMSQHTVERVGNLIAKSSYETAYSTIILESLFSDAHKQARSELDLFRKEAAQRMRNRFDKESAEQISSLMAEHQVLLEEKVALETRITEVTEKLNQAVEAANKNKKIALAFKEKLESSEQERKEEREALDTSLRFTRGLITYIKENTGIMKSGAKAIDEYTEKNAVPKGL